MAYQVKTPLGTTLTDGTKTVAASGTPEALVASDVFVHEVTIYPLRTNTGLVYLGATAVNDAQHIPPPFIITAPNGTFINLANVFVDVTVNGEGVYFFYTA